MSGRSTFDAAARPIYTKEQLHQYFDRISLPQRYRDSPILSDPFLARTLEHGLPLLTALQRHQLTSIPFENLSLHYSPSRLISVDPSHVFSKMVSRNAGRGGYCMENTLLLLTVLRSLGYTVTSTAARVNNALEPGSEKKGHKGPAYNGWNHMVNLVEMDGKKFLVDVGMGSLGPTRPVELVVPKDNDSGPGDAQVSIEGKGIDTASHDGGANGWLNVGPAQRSRLLRKRIPDTVSQSPDQALWVYEVQFSPGEHSWHPRYCFSEVEFLPNDYEVMSHFTATHPTSWFTWMVVCVKFIAETNKETGELEIVGDVTLTGDEVKRRTRGKRELLAKCESEDERVDALEMFFGVKLSGEERAAIKGTKTAL